MRAGIIGVWTDFKVQYLAYELQTRLGLRDVAVCSALTASRSRLAHRQALEHMAANLGVTVIDSIPEFLAWLGIEAQAVAPAVAKGTPRPTVELPDGRALDDEERRLVEYLYRGCRSVQLRPIGGGYSGSRVFGSLPVDRMGRREIPFVTKIDLHDRIARERVAVEGVENLLGANAPRLADYVDLETRGAIKYHFATMHAGEARTLQRAFREADGPAAARTLFDRVIERVLRRLYQSPGSTGSTCSPTTVTGRPTRRRRWRASPSSARNATTASSSQGSPSRCRILAASTQRLQANGLAARMRSPSRPSTVT